MSTARYAGLDEDGEYAIYGLAINGKDVEIRWTLGFLTIYDDDGRCYADTEPESFTDAEATIAWLTQCDFDKEDSYDPAPHWQPVRRERIPRPLERQR